MKEVKDQIAQFSDKTFGADRSWKAPLHHLKKEVDEVIQSKGKKVEYADCLILLFDSYRKLYPYDDDLSLLKQECLDKIPELYTRQWQNADSNGVIEHVRPKRLRIPFLPRYTKWQVLTAYNRFDYDYLVMFRKNLSTGMIRFRVIQLTNISSMVFHQQLTDLQQNFDRMIEM